MAYKSVVDNSISENNLKLTADKIIKDLDQLREEGKKSKRRWIWELMQNAKDVPNRFGSVSIDVVLSHDKLTFSHNGNPFTVNNLTGLVQQVSSKHSDNKDMDVTGKFGTGFIATHLLSEEVIIKGIVHEEGNNAKSFTLSLDRSGITSEELIPSIEKALLDLNNIDSSDRYRTVDRYEENRLESHYDTAFSYQLTSETLSTAQIGITDLIKTLPTALVFLDSIKQVRVKNEIENTHFLFKVKETSIIHSEYSNISVEIINELDRNKDDFKCYILKTKEDIQLLVEQTKDLDFALIHSTLGEVPFIYRDFPLIGSEGFCFPFILNGKTLKPTERRDSIYLNGRGKNAKENRQILERAINDSLEFVDFLVSQKAKNLYGVCMSGLPEYNFDEDDDTKEWYIENIQQHYRRHLVEKRIVGKDDELIPLKDVRFPISKDKGADQLRELMTQFLGSAKVPSIDDQERWTDCLGPLEEIVTWDLDLVYGIDELAADISAQELFLETTAIEEPIKWLNSFYQVIDEQNEQKLHTYNKLVLNQMGDFKKLSDLSFEEFSEDESSSFLPDPFLDLLLNLGINWRDNLVRRDLVLPNQGLRKKSMSDLNSALNEIFKKEDFLGSDYALDRLLEAHAIVTPNSQEDSLQRQLLKFAEHLFNKKTDLVPDRFAAKFNFEIVHRLLIKLINKGIEKYETIGKLSVGLCMEREATLNWLDNYLRLLDSKSDYAKYLEEGSIVPNRSENLQFCKYADLFNYGVNSQPLDDELLLIYYRLGGENHFNKLVADGIGIKLAKTLNFEMLGNDVVNRVDEINYRNELEENRDALLELINWIETNSALTNKYLSKLKTMSGRLFYMLTIENSESRDDVMKILRNQNSIKSVVSILEHPKILAQLNELSEVFPDGIPNEVLDYAKESARKKKEFNNMLEVGSEVEKLLMETLSNYRLSSTKDKIIHAGGGAYDIRVFNPITNKSFYIEVKSCRHNNTDPINIAISQAKRAVKEVVNNNYCFVIVERPNGNDIDTDYIKSNLRYLQNPGEYLTDIVDSYVNFKKAVNTTEKIALVMENEDIKGALDYNWIKEKTSGSGFEELLNHIKRVLSS